MDRYGLAGKRVTVMGLGTRAGGVGVARFLAEHGAIVTVTDGKKADELAASIAELDGLPIRYVLGGHDDRDFTSDGADIVLRNPGVRRDSRYLELARSTGVRVEMEMSLFFGLCPGNTVGITGTKGKTTTSYLCAHMLTAWRSETVLGGNMGITALGQLDRITADTPVVIEISNWQLEALDERGLGPKIAVLTNISEDHLNTYNGFDDYANTKRSIARHLSENDRLILNRDDEEAWKASAETNAKIVPYGEGDRDEPGVWFDDEQLTVREGAIAVTIPFPAHVIAGGRHLRSNAAAAAAAARQAGAPIDAIAAGLAAFTGVRDRNELVANVGGVDFVNDTAATSPIATVAALETYAGRGIHLITGGAEKQIALDPIAVAAAKHAKRVYLLAGSASAELGRLLTAQGVEPIGLFDSMPAIVATAAECVEPGDVVLLSPGCASFGLFRDEFDRGEQFRQAVRRLEAGAGAAR